MSALKPSPAVDRDPVVTAFENATPDPDALTAEQIAEFEARMGKPAGRGRSGEDVITELGERTKRDG